MNIFYNRAAIIRKQRGTISVMSAVLLIPLIGFAALAIDISNLLVVRNELQNAADAAALAGASKLNSTPTGFADPIWNNAEISAVTAIKLNKSSGTTLVDATAITGYWDITQTVTGLQSNGITPGTNDKPAVQVTVSRKSGLNGGNVISWLAPMIGIQSMPVSAVATAVLAPFGSGNPGQIFPVAITQCLLDNYWDSLHNKPILASSTAPLPNTTWPQVVGQPYEFRITSSYHAGPCESGQWTSLLTDSNNVPTIRNLIANGNPDPINIGDSIWIEPGTKTALYGSVPVPADVCLSIVQNLSTHALAPVLGFVGFHIDASVGGSGKYIEGHFTQSAKCGGSGTGPSYGTYAPPRLSQ